MDKLVLEPVDLFTENYYEQRIIRALKNSSKGYLTTEELENILGVNPTKILTKLRIVYEFEPGKWKLTPDIEHIYILPQQSQQQNRNFQNKRYYRKYNYDYTFGTTYDLKNKSNI
ncbi:MAG: hypothetical protein ACP5IB_06670 [Thermoplasmata archaeon]